MVTLSHQGLLLVTKLVRDIHKATGERFVLTDELLLEKIAELLGTMNDHNMNMLFQQVLQDGAVSRALAKRLEMRVYRGQKVSPVSEPAPAAPVEKTITYRGQVLKQGDAGAEQNNASSAQRVYRGVVLED